MSHWLAALRASLQPAGHGLDEVRAWLLRRHRPVGGWQFERRFLVFPIPVWRPRVCAADHQPWPEACPVIRALRADDPELDHAVESGYLPNLLR
jgi:hypothetical protein